MWYQCQAQHIVVEPYLFHRYAKGSTPKDMLKIEAKLKDGFEDVNCHIGKWRGKIS